MVAAGSGRSRRVPRGRNSTSCARRGRFAWQAQRLLHTDFVAWGAGNTCSSLAQLVAVGA